MQPQTEVRLLTVKETAKLTGLSVSFIYKLVEIRKIPHLRLGTQIRFATDDIQAWLEQSHVKAV